ncbi:MAG: hypothetical protein ACREQY_06865 [Candidatus Binatia bacterium]
MIFVHGFELRQAEPSLREKILRGVREAASELGKPLLEVETNLRTFSDPLCAWGWRYHGSALASVALLLSPRFHKIYIPGAHPYRHLAPWGSHPLVDPLWSTEGIEIVHDGCEATRAEKVARISGCETVLRWLRVCFRNTNGAYDCGRCEKCVRTMISLRIVGALERCPTFESPLDLDAVRRLEIPDDNIRSLTRENLEAAESRGDDQALVEALRSCLRGAPEVTSAFRVLRRVSARLGLRRSDERA